MMEVEKMRSSQLADMAVPELQDRKSTRLNSSHCG